MCGIVGYVGDKQAATVLTVGLTKLEYRGYDSAGVAVLNGTNLQVRKRVGKLPGLIESLKTAPVSGHAGIGHTRWATHGEPTETNAHPHCDCTGHVAIVHNGIIENYADLRRDLEARGHRFASETDSEVVAHLIEETSSPPPSNPLPLKGERANGEGVSNLLDRVRTALQAVRGSYAIVVACADCPNELVAARNQSPLVVGLGKKENFVASDVPAILNHTRHVVFLDNGEFARITPEEVLVTDGEGRKRQKASIHIEWDTGAAEKEGFAHFMLKEVHEQPTVIRHLVERYASPDRSSIRFDNLNIAEQELREVNRVFIQACGTSYHAGLVGRLLLQRHFLANLPVEVQISSEFRYEDAVFEPGTLLISISQSGETADALAGLREGKRLGLRTLSIVNVIGSTIARESDGVIYTHAGPEIGVASTKAYTAQLGALYLLALHLGNLRGVVDARRMQRRLNDLERVADLMEEVLERQDQIAEVAARYQDREHFIFVGRNFGFPSALEGALKLKEISYVHAEGYAAGELKHGPLALVDERMPVVAIATSGLVYEKMVSNLQEVKARKGKVIAIASDNDEEIAEYADEVIRVPELTESFSPFVVAVPLQLLAYHIAVLRGCDVDQPRNLAKSVTVE